MVFWQAIHAIAGLDIGFFIDLVLNNILFVFLFYVMIHIFFGGKKTLYFFFPFAVFFFSFFFYSFVFFLCFSCVHCLVMTLFVYLINWSGRNRSKEKGGKPGPGRKK